jgi:4-diphosphocytidyl-2-C-methyl-D-erythritol kinase
METLSRESPAKINLTLRVADVRPDGFHEIESLVAQIGLCDQVSVTPREDRRHLVECDDRTIPCDETNLARRAARLLAETAGVRRGALISLTKRIPAGAGLGGGSSNAAATLKLLNGLWRLGLSHPDLAGLGAQLGSDVPLFCYGPLSVIRGRGDEVEELRDCMELYAALVLPGLHCSTAEVYAAFDRLPDRPIHPSLGEVRTATHSAARLMEVLYNDLEPAAFAVAPQLHRLAERVTELATGPVRMSGSGSTLYRLFDRRDDAALFAGEVQQRLSVRTAVAPLLTS